MANPYVRNGMYYFYDETMDEHGPFKSIDKAYKELRNYNYWLEHGPTLWQRVWWSFRYYRLWHTPK